MKFRFTLPALNVRTGVLSFSLFLFFSCFFSFHVYIRRLHKTSLLSHQGTPTELIAEFLEGAPQVSKSVSEVLEYASNRVTTLETMKNSSDCTPFTVASRFEPTTTYREIATFPQWMKDYFDWHRELTSKINKCNFKDYKYLILRCSDKERKCGGVADRLKSLPFYIASAAQSKRIFLIRWQRPVKLEEFLLPNEIDWSVPDWMYEETNGFENSHPVNTAHGMKGYLARHKHLTIVESLLQDFYGGSSYYYRLDCEMDASKELDNDYLDKFVDMAGWHDYEIIFRDLFYTVFEPSPNVEKLVKDHLIASNLVPGKFSTTQYRAFYGVELQKHVLTEEKLTNKARNAINCASFVQPGDPIFFASDSHAAVLYARNMAETTGRKIVTFDDEKEALHLDKKEHWKSGNVSDFYPSFVDLLIMAEARCMSHGVGGFGRFANLLSIDTECVIRHDSERVKSIQICNWHDTKSDLKTYW